MRREVIRMYRDGRRLSDEEMRSATGVVADVRVQTVQRGTRVVSDALMTECPNPYPRLLEPRWAGIAVLALGIEGFEEIVQGVATVYLRQCWLCPGAEELTYCRRVAGATPSRRVSRCED
jgi:hypothetical protein